MFINQNQNELGEHKDIMLSLSFFSAYRVLSPFRGGGIVYLNDPDSYAGWRFILLVGPPKPDRLKDRGQTK